MNRRELKKLVNTFLTCPNWIEHRYSSFVVLPLAAYTKRPVAGLAVEEEAVILLEHLIRQLVISLLQQTNAMDAFVQAQYECFIQAQSRVRLAAH